MPRIRTVKPEFWQHEVMAGLSDHARLLAIALLNYSDDEGYFPAHVALVRAACFPFEEDFEKVRGSLQELSNIGYIEVRSGGGKTIGRVINFLDHQRIDKAQKSKIAGQFAEIRTEKQEKPEGNKPFEDGSGSVPGIVGEQSGNPTRLEGEGEGEQGTGEREQGKGNGTGGKGTEISAIAAPPPPPPPPSYQQVIGTWNERRSQSCRMTDARRKVLAARWKDPWWRDNWLAAIDKVCESDFCNGQNNRGWTADLDWFLRPDTATKLIEGKFANAKGGYHLTEQQKRLENTKRAMEDFINGSI